MSEPDFLFQTAEPMTSEERLAWIKARIEKAGKEGATFFRASIHDDIPNLTLLEGWREQPDDQGPIRWQFAAEQPKEPARHDT